MSIHSILPTLQKQYPAITFKEGDLFVWSPKEAIITYTAIADDEEYAVWALLHEVAHAALGHQHYKSDVDLLRHEVDAWREAKAIAKSLHTTIEEDHIQDCLDTYRDWLHKRATCPNCLVISLQQDDGSYKCFNCQTKWKVPASPLCRITRRVVNE